MRSIHQRPEEVKNLGVFDYEVEPLTPELLVEKLGKRHSNLVVPACASCNISFKHHFLEKFNQSAQKIALLISNEFEGFSKNGGIGTYYTTLSQKLAADGWYVILLLCQTEADFQGEASLDYLHHVFSTHETEQVLNLQPIHYKILTGTQQDVLGTSFDYQSLCCLFFIQGIVASFPDAVVYVEFPDIWGFGYRTIQAKRTGLLGNSCLIAVTAHGCFQWLREVNSKYTVEQPQWFWQAYHYEQFSYENTDVAYFPSYFLKSKLESYGWKISQAKHLPYFVPIVKLLSNDSVQPFGHENSEAGHSPALLLTANREATITQQNNLNSEKIPVVFFCRLEERKGLCTFLEAIKLLESTVAEKIQIIFIGKIIPLQSSQLQHLDSQQYIEQELNSHLTYNLFPNLSSQEAIKLVTELDCPIVCLTSLQENFPNTALEMGQLPISLVVSDTGGFRETLNLIERSDCVRWFQPGNSHSLARSITQAINAYPKTPLIPKRDFLEQVNQRLLNQRLEYMSQAFVNAAPKEPKTPSVRIAIFCQHPVNTLLECLESLNAQTYNNFDVIIGYQESTDESVQEVINQAQTKFPSYKYLSLDANWSLGETYNYLVDLAAGEYFLRLAVEHTAMPDMVEKLVTAALVADADVVVCPQATLGGDGELEELALIDGSLLKLLEFDRNQDISALFSVKLLKEFQYSQERGLLALNWHILAAAIATGKEIAYYPYPLYVTSTSSESIISAENLPKERYYLRQYLYQIEPSKWNQRQLNLLLTGVEQLLQQQVSLQNHQQLSPRSQAWMLTAQLLQEELTQTQVTLKNLQAWNQQLQAGKDWLESQWQAWMLRAQKAEVEWKRSRWLIHEMQGSKFWKLRKAWIKLKQKLGKISADPLQPPAYTFTPGVQEFVARIAGQKIRFFQPSATEAPVVSIISSCFREYEYIETTYRSIINQTLQNFEWIIVDDGSTHPETKALLTSLPQRTAKIRVVSQAAHRGVAASYNSAIAQANGQYLCFIDIGGILDPTYLEKCILVLETHPQVSVVNSYSIVFQAQEHWWQPHLNQPTSLFHQNGMMSHLLYRKADFDQLGGFDESLHEFADWERCLKAVAHHQIGWTIPEYLDCYRTNENTPAIAQHPDKQQTIEAIHSRYQTFFANPPTIALEPQPLKLDTLRFRLNVENRRERPNPGKRILLFCEALDSCDVAKRNCELVILLEQRGYDVAIATTSTSDHSCQEFFYQATPDIFHLPNLFDKAHWLAFIRYILASRQIDSIFISGSEIAYSFLPLLRAEFPQVALIDYTYIYDANCHNGASNSCQFVEDLDCQIVPSQRLAKVYRSLNSTANQVKVCSAPAEIETVLIDAIKTRRQTSVQANMNTELEAEALLLILEYLQNSTPENLSEVIAAEGHCEPTGQELLLLLLNKLRSIYHSGGLPLLINKLTKIPKMLTRQSLK